MFKEKVTQVLDTSVFAKGNLITLVSMEWTDDGQLEPGYNSYNGIIIRSTEESFTFIDEDGEYKDIPIERIHNVSDPKNTAWVHILGIARKIERKM